MLTFSKKHGSISKIKQNKPLKKHTRLGLNDFD